MKNVIDFHGASHGHFLEYVINTWIYNGPRVPEVFTDLGTSHLPQKNQEYLLNRQIACGHYTEKNLPLPRPSKIIRITLDSQTAQLIHTINVIHRIGDITFDKQLNEIPNDVRQSPCKLRNNIYSKLTEYHNGYKIDYKWKWGDVLSFDFDMENLYELRKFYQSLTNCAEYLEQKFVPDHELSVVWKKFIDLNQGLQAYRKSTRALNLAFKQQNEKIELSITEQAMLNVLLSQTLNVYDAPMFVEDNYPLTTIEIWNQIQCHLDEFDNKF